MTRRRKLAALILVSAVALGVSACGDRSLDGDTGTVPSNDVFSVTLRPVITCSPVESGITVPTVGNSSDPASMAVITIDGESCQLGPTAATGAVFADDAKATLADPEWVVNVGIRPGPAGADLLNVVTAKCYQRVAGCASGQMALVVDGNVVMRASVMAPEFAGSLQIAGNYTQEQAEALAVALNHAT